ncbi:DUF1778 domain-containing protein [Moraxella sp. ZY210820]|uniref:type II toxin -antitoxin system TacA 1-like antitoxin n=1 Tax=unclassified Moraxella TaxID=2685852 RepID=UPI00273180CA|nr:DUF1778 domain-containing protein [Moraxella sp. ZY210820]WLF84901.1 DUF1778 domain-containing protein [Moraxella sp. ZY210820]
MYLDIAPQTRHIIEKIAHQQGRSVEDFIIMSAYEKALYSLTKDESDNLDFDLEQMKEMMQGLETPEERAKNTTEMPEWAFKDLVSFDKWLASV